MMRIVFFGTPEFAVPSLQILLDHGYQIAAVVTVPDKKSGRGLQLKASPVKTFAESRNLKIMQPEKLSDPGFQEELKSINADLFIVVAFRMLPESIWKMPPQGTFYLHSSLLPYYRGAAPINRAIMNGENKTGVTTFFLKHEIDTGNIIYQQELNIGPDENAGSLHDRLMNTGAELVLKTVNDLTQGSVQSIPQEHLIAEGTVIPHAPKIFPKDCQIDWNQSALKIHNLIRGLSPYPGAFTHIRNQDGKTYQLKIYESRLTDQPSDGLPGTISPTSKGLLVNCSDQSILLTELQLEGKKKMRAEDFLRGFSITGYQMSKINPQ